MDTGGHSSKIEVACAESALHSSELRVSLLSCLEGVPSPVDAVVPFGMVILRRLSKEADTRCKSRP